MRIYNKREKLKNKNFLFQVLMKFFKINCTVIQRELAALLILFGLFFWLKQY